MADHRVFPPKKCPKPNSTRVNFLAHVNVCVVEHSTFWPPAGVGDPLPPTPKSLERLSSRGGPTKRDSQAPPRPACDQDDIPASRSRTSSSKFVRTRCSKYECITSQLCWNVTRASVMDKIYMRNESCKGYQPQSGRSDGSGPFASSAGKAP